MKNDLHSNVVVAIRPEVPIIDGMVDIKLLKPHPLNLKAYDFESEESKNEIEALAKDIRKKGLMTPIGIDLYGTIYLGHRRYFGHMWHLLDKTKIKAYRVDCTYDPTSVGYDEQTELELLYGFNGDKNLTRDEKKWAVVCRKYNTWLKPFLKQFPLQKDNKRSMSMKEDEFSRMESLNINHLRAVLKIYNGYTKRDGTYCPADKALVSRIDNDVNLTLNAAKKEHENSATSKKKAIPNQYNAVEDFKYGNKARDVLLDTLFNEVKKQHDNTWKVDGEDVNWLHPKHGKEKSKVAGSISDFAMCALNKVLNDVLSIKSVTAAGSNKGKDNGPDILLVDKSAEVLKTLGSDYARETLEVKSGTQREGDTLFYGDGPGMKMAPHRRYFLLVSSDDNASKFFILLGKLMPEDIDGSGNIPLKRYLNNHRDKDDYTVLHGDHYYNNDKNPVVVTHVDMDKRK